MRERDSTALAAVSAVLHRLAVATDRLDVDELRAIYYADAHLFTPGWTASGVDEIIARMKGDPETDPGAKVVRHHLTTMNVSLMGSDIADVRTYFMVFTEHGLDHAGLYADRLRKDRTDCWRLAERRCQIEHRHAGSFINRILPAS
jgi:hypothetical protein